MHLVFMKFKHEQNDLKADFIAFQFTLEILRTYELFYVYPKKVM